jgi:hypothetical protein
MKHQQLYTDLHIENPDLWVGYSTCDHLDRIKNLIELTGSVSLLDYGCGKGHQYSILKYDEHWRVLVDCYDFAIPEFDALKDEQYDGVISIRVLSTVPDEEVDTVLKNIFERANKFVYLVIDKVPGKVFNNKQVIIYNRSQQWWDDKILEHNTNGIVVTGYGVSEYPVALGLPEIVWDPDSPILQYQ